MPRHALPILVACIVVTACAAVATDNVALPRYHWQLSGAIDSDRPALDALVDHKERPLQLDFSANALTVHNACNAIHGRYRLAKGHLVVDLLAQTMMACPQAALMQREAVIKHVLRGAPSLVLSSDRGHVQLTLGASDGQQLVFTGVPVDEDR